MADGWVLREFEGATAAIADPAALRKKATERLRRIARCEEVRLCESADGDGEFLPTASSYGTSFDPGPSFGRDSRLIQWLEVNAQCLPLPDDSGVFEYLAIEEQNALSSAQVRLCVPILGTQRLLGVFLCRNSQRNWRLKAAEMATLLACARHAGNAFFAVDQQQAENRRLRTLHRAQRLVAAGQMAAGVAHEVRNPLSNVRSTIQYVLTSNSEWPHKLSLLSDALHEIDRIDQIVSGMLSMSRPTTPTMADTDVVQVVCDAVKLVRGCPDAREVEFHVIVAEPCPIPTVHADAQELRQVFVNLLLNACQAQPIGGVVKVKLDIVGDDSGRPGQAAVRITDQGPGIPQVLLKRVFDPFYTSKTNGTGLGLPICLEIIARHGGHLHLQCPADGGTVATVLLPLKEGS